MLSLSANAQNPGDSTELVIKPSDSLTFNADEVTEVVIDTLENRPNTAALYSAALPGLGQAYNGKHWKIPILYGGAVVVGYFMNYNHQLYKQYRDGLFALTDGDDRTEPFNPNLGENDYRRATDYWRRNRDLLVIAAIVLYAANVVDAHVDAHLALFTIDEDISLNLEPSFDQTVMQTNLYGLSLKLRFN
jgi:hypothetical protein